MIAKKSTTKWHLSVSRSNVFNFKVTCVDRWQVISKWLWNRFFHYQHNYCQSRSCYINITTHFQLLSSSSLKDATKFYVILPISLHSWWFITQVVHEILTGPYTKIYIYIKILFGNRNKLRKFTNYAKTINVTQKKKQNLAFTTCCFYIFNSRTYILTEILEFLWFNVTFVSTSKQIFKIA